MCRVSRSLCLHFGYHRSRKYENDFEELIFFFAIFETMNFRLNVSTEEDWTSVPIIPRNCLESLSCTVVDFITHFLREC